MTHSAARTARIVTIPNLLTVLRFILIGFFVKASLRSQFDLAFTLFVTAGVTDVIDGFIARRFNQRSRIGAILDPAADKLLMLFGIIVFTFFDHVGSRLPDWLTVSIFARDFLISTFAYLLYTRIHITRFPPSAAGKISTLTQIVALSAAIAANATSPTLVWLGSQVLGPMSKIALVATLYSGFDYLRRAEAMLVKATGESS